MAGMNITTRTTIENLAKQIKATFAKKTELTPIQTAANAAFKSLNVSGNTVSFYTSTDKSGTAAATFDFPAEYFLDQQKTALVDNFVWSETAYPGTEDPELDGKPVFVLAVKGDDNSATYSFANMETLVDTYKAKTTGKDASTTVTISGFEVDVKVNISQEEGNTLIAKEDGLYVASTKVSGATANNLAKLNADGSLADSGIAAANVLQQSDISDYTEQEIAALLADEEPGGTSE